MHRLHLLGRDPTCRSSECRCKTCSRCFCPYFSPTATCPTIHHTELGPWPGPAPSQWLSFLQLIIRRRWKILRSCNSNLKSKIRTFWPKGVPSSQRRQRASPGKRHLNKPRVLCSWVHSLRNDQRSAPLFDPLTKGLAVQVMIPSSKRFQTERWRDKDGYQCMMTFKKSLKWKSHLQY